MVNKRSVLTTITSLTHIPDHKTSTGSLLIPDPNTQPINASTSELLHADYMPTHAHNHRQCTQPPTTTNLNTDFLPLPLTTPYLTTLQFHKGLSDHKRDQAFNEQRRLFPFHATCTMLNISQWIYLKRKQSNGPD